MSILMKSQAKKPPQARVLIIDDEHAVRDVVRRALERAGYACAVAADTAEAWTHLQNHPVDLITLDIDMPGGSGLSFLPNLQREFPDLAAIMLTAIGELDTAIEALTNGAHGFLTKPVDFADLLQCVEKTLKHRESILQKNHYIRQLEKNAFTQDDSIRSTDQQTVRLLVQASLYRDEETGSHVQRVGESSALLASAMGWSRESTARMRLAAPLHDIGKLGVPDGILQKPGKLTTDEFQLMKMHVAIGGRLLSGCESPTLKLASEIALNHHERWDGKGYLNSLSGTSIPHSARIVSVVDVFDALTHDRVYRRAFPVDEAIKIVREGSGSQFDPEVVHAFLDVLPLILEVDSGVQDEFCSPSDDATNSSTSTRDVSRVSRDGSAASNVFRCTPAYIG